MYRPVTVGRAEARPTSRREHLAVSMYSSDRRASQGACSSRG